jgi:hypothetical protein
MLLSIAALLICGCINAQKYTDLISVSEQYSPSNGYKFGNGKCDVHDQNFAAKAPLKINATDYLLVGLGANHLEFIGDAYPGGSSFTALTLQLGYIGNFGRYNLTAVALPKISGDFAEITHRDFQMGGLLLLSVKYSDNFKLKYGCYYNQEFFGPLIVPLIGLDWKVNDKLRVLEICPLRKQQNILFQIVLPQDCFSMQTRCPTSTINSGNIFTKARRRFRPLAISI